MFEAFFTDSCLRYRIEVINGIDFYGLGFGMVRGESMGKWLSEWMQKGETASVLITNTKLPDTSGFELAERIRSQCPRVRVIFVTDTPSLAEAQQAVRCGAYDYLPKSDGIDALRSAMIRVSEELHTESREEAYLRGQQNWDECISRLLKLLLALKPGIDEDHWQMYSKVKPLLSDAPLRMEALLVRSLMEELRAEICRRDEALAAACCASARFGVSVKKITRRHGNCLRTYLASSNPDISGRLVFVMSTAAASPSCIQRSVPSATHSPRTMLNPNP